MAHLPSPCREQVLLEAILTMFETTANADVTGAMLRSYQLLSDAAIPVCSRDSIVRLEKGDLVPTGGYRYLLLTWLNLPWG